MGDVHYLVIPKRNKVYMLETCSGCHKEVGPREGHEVCLPYDDYDQYIVLCDRCFTVAKRYMT